MKELTEQQIDKLSNIKKLVSDAYDLTQEQRLAANEDMRFCNVDGGMWEDWLKDLGPERAKLEFDITTDYVQRYVGEWMLNRANVTFTPDDTETDEDDADLITGVYRGDFKDNDGQISQDNAVAEMAECGVGHFRLMTKFVDEEDPENESQDIHWGPIYNSYATVIWDPQGKRLDKADAGWCAVLTSYTKDAFEDTYPDASPISAYQPETLGWLDWVVEDTIYVVEMYKIVPLTETVSVYRNIEMDRIAAYSHDELDKIKDELREDGWEFVRERTVKRNTVEKSIVTSVDFIEEDVRIPGKYIPIIPVYGYRKYVDEKERYRGLVRKLKDANRLFNANVSRMAESASSSPDGAPYFSENQVEGKTDQLADKTLPFHILNDVEDANGNPMPAGPVWYEPPNQVDPNTIASTQVISDYVQRVTGSAPQDQISSEASGVLVDKLRKRENLNTQVPTDNTITSIKHSGKVYESMANEIYADLRTKRSVAEDGSASLQQINTTIIDKESGTQVIANTFIDKRYKVDVQVGPQYESQREATVETLERLIALVGVESKYFEPLMAMWMKNISGTGLEELKEFNRDQMLRMGLTEPETEEEEKMLAQLSQQVDPQEELNASIAAQQQAEARSLDASAEQKLADTMKKKAETVEILHEIGQPVSAIK